MDLYREILANIIRSRELVISFKIPETNMNQLIESKCYNILKQVAEIIRNCDHSDTSCFEKIEEIVQLFEKERISAGARHDF